MLSRPTQRGEDEHAGHRSSRVVATGIAAALAAAVAVPALSGAQAPTAVTITVQEKVRTVATDDLAPKSRSGRVSAGDRLCTVTYRFADGQIVAAGAFKLDGSAEVPIVGGTGAYAGASGTVKPGRPARGFDSADVITITPAA